MAFARKNVKDLQKQLNSLNKTSEYGPDVTEWKPTTDAQGNGTAIIRFLPATDTTGHVMPFIKIFNHGFKEGSRWFIENCPTTLGHECPVCAANSELWATEIDSNRAIARKRKRTLSYWANILVVKDAKNPSSEGKVFKYRFGQKIMDKIEAKTSPDEDMGIAPEDVTCVFEGSNFVLKIKRVPGQFPGQTFPNYDESMFQTPSELFGGDEQKLGELESQLHDLSKIVSPDKFKSAEELQDSLNKVLRINPSSSTAAAAKPTAAAVVEPVKPAATSITNENVGDDPELDDILSDLGL